MLKIQKKIVVDDHGNPQEAIIPWSQFCDIVERLGLDLDQEAEADLRATRKDLEDGKNDAFVPLSKI